jgi:hypothetical protein
MTDARLLTGLRIRLERTKDVLCGVCGQTVVVIEKAAGPHVASLHCASCDRHRGWLPKAIADLLVGTTRRFGWPPEAITIRNSRKRKRPRLWVHPRSRPPHPEPENKRQLSCQTKLSSMIFMDRSI